MCIRDRFYRSYHVDIVDTQTKYRRMKKGGEERQDDKMVAPMPGKVVKIPVRKGDRLSSGDIVVVLEAMKMQSNYLSLIHIWSPPGAGCLKELVERTEEGPAKIRV